MPRHSGRGQAQIGSQAEIIVGTEIYQRLPVENDRRALRAGMRDELTAQMCGVEFRKFVVEPGEWIVWHWIVQIGTGHSAGVNDPYTGMNAKVQGAEMTNSAKDLRGQAVRVVTQRIEDLQRAGVTHLAKPQAVSVRPKVAAESLFKSDVADVETIVPPDKRAAALEVIRTEVAACTRCTELAETRTQTVFGVGSPTARICFFGEAPGADEDRQGEPFVGRAGQLLTKMIQACGLARGGLHPQRAQVPSAGKSQSAAG